MASSDSSSMTAEETGETLLERERKYSEASSKADSDTEELEAVPFEGDTYTASIVVLVRDLYKIQQGSKNTRLRYARILLTLSLTIANIFTQIFLMVQVKLYVSSKAVHDIRDDYDVFEYKMYPGDHTYMTVNGKHRGTDHRFFQAKNFELLSDGEKESVCNIPFSNLHFLGVVLFIWTMTCFGELRQTCEHFQNLIMNLESTSSMRDCTDEIEDKSFVIKRLPKYMKALLTIVIFIPRFAITLVLLWLGCRWLAATNDFTDLLLNGVALEFILSLRSLLYTVLVPGRTQREAESTTVEVPGKEIPTCGTFLGTFLWGVLACAWVTLYIMYFQRVLPEYKFDVRHVCADWRAIRYAV